MLRGILAARGSLDSLIEIDKDSPSAPAYAAEHASPTILLNGEDLFPTGVRGNACRIYVHEDGKRSGIPSRIAVEKMIDLLSSRSDCLPCGS